MTIRKHGTGEVILDKPISKSADKAKDWSAQEVKELDKELSEE